MGWWGQGGGWCGCKVRSCLSRAAPRLVPHPPAAPRPNPLPPALRPIPHSLLQEDNGAYLSAEEAGVDTEEEGSEEEREELAGLGSLPSLRHMAAAGRRRSSSGACMHLGRVAAIKGKGAGPAARAARAAALSAGMKGPHPIHPCAPHLQAWRWRQPQIARSLRTACTTW